MEITRVMMQRK